MAGALFTLAGSLAITAVAASGCANVLAPTNQVPSVASGWQAQLVATGLKRPRSLQFDSTGALLVVEAGKGVTRHTFKDNGGTCLQLDQSALVINKTELNHGLGLSSDGKTIYASSSSSVYSWAYDAKAGSVSGAPRALVANMSNNDLVTRTLLVSTKKDNTLVVSRGSSDTLMAEARTLNSGLSQIRAFDLTQVPSDGPYSFNDEGTVLGWGLRNSVGVAEHPVTGGLYGVENSVDGARRQDKDVHENNPGEELNYFGVLGSKDHQGGNYGYPQCFAVWDASEIPNNDGLKVGAQFAVQENSTLSDESCAADYVAPRLTFPAHMAPLDIKFDAAGATAYITFHGSFDKTSPVGYRVSTVAFDASKGEPSAASDSTTALSDILSNADMSKCPDACFRPVGLAWDSAKRLWVSSDSTGELYVLQKMEAASAPGKFVTGPTSGGVRVTGGKMLCGFVAVCMAALYL